MGKIIVAVAPFRCNDSFLHHLVCYRGGFTDVMGSQFGVWMRGGLRDPGSREFVVN